MTDSIRHKKKAMIEALEKSLGIVTTACKQVGISRDTHYRWLKEDESYKEQVESIGDIALDFAESKLHKQIESGDTTATIFFLKTKGKKRGYIERQELDHSGSIKPVIIDWRGDNIHTNGETESSTSSPPTE
jgi:hypothetical protein